MSDDRTIPSFSTRLWSEEVGMADPSANFNAPPVLGYTFGGRTLTTDVNSTLYNQVPQIPALLDVHFTARQAQRVAALAEVSEHIAIDGVAATGQRGQIAAVWVPVDGLEPQNVAEVATGQRQLAALLGGITSENITTGSTVTTSQGQRGVAQIAINGANPPAVGTASSGQRQYAAAVVAVNGIQPGSDAPIAIGGEITNFKLENTSTTPLTNTPFSFGQVFVAGHLPAAGANVSLALADNTPLSCQIDVKATHGDGSVRHAIISGIIPQLAASATQTVTIRRAAPAPGLPAVSLPPSLPSATLVIAGATYTATCAGVAPDTWLAGPCASDYVFNVPFTGAGGPHATLMAQFSVRRFSTGQVRVDAVLEHCKAYLSTADITYDVTIVANGATVYSKTGLVHTPAARWKRTFWYGTAPALHIRHNTPYLIASRQIPNYDQSITIPESVLAGYATDLASTRFDPMGFGRFAAYMPTTGGRADIGLMPDSYVATVLSMDKRAKAMMLASADIGGSWPVCRRDDSSGPGRGLPLSVVNFPYSSVVGNPGDCINPATGKNEKLPILSSASQGVPDSSHQPAIYYLPYLLTGDFFYLEGLHFYGTFNHYQDNPYYRDFAKAHVRADQVRGQGWSMRTLAECAAITPEGHPLKSHFQTWYTNNISWFVARYPDGNDNTLGIITNGYALGYTVNGQANTGMAPWMDDFFTQAIGHGIELLGNSEARRLLLWKAKFQLGRLLDPAVCIQDCSTYALGVRTTSTAPFFATLAECFAWTVPAAQQQYPCNSPQRLALTPGLLPGDIGGYPGSTEGYAADYQPALAVAVDSGYPGGATAWAKFMARPTKPDYGYEPQFAIVPRTV
jgi:hypothetical protein